MAKVNLSFGDWKDGQVAPTVVEVPVAAGRPRPRVEAISRRLARELVHPAKPDTSVAGVRFSPDGKRLIAGDYPSGVVVVWDFESGEPLTTIETGHGLRGSMDYLFVTPDWKSLFVAHGGPRDYEKVERNGKSLYRWTFDGEVRVWDLNTGMLTRRFRHQPPRFIQSIEHSPDGSRFITLDWLSGEHESRVTAVTLWNALTGENRSLQVGKNAFGRFSADGKSVVLVTATDRGMSQSLQLFDSTDGQQRWSIAVAAENTQTGVIAFSQDSRFLLADRWKLTSDMKFDEWHSTLLWIDAATGREVDSIDGGPNGQFYANRFSPDGRSWAVSNLSGDISKLDLYNVDSRKIKKSILLGRRETGSRMMGSTPAFSRDGKWIALVCKSMPITRENDGDIGDHPQPRIHLIDIDSGELRETMIAPSGYIQSLEFSPDGRWLATGGHGKVHVWDLSGIEPRTK